ncbi:hypothetical protein NDU88_001982 [Pleurodeles waltl]|uniref:Uncharacterized protein n=1 Tax=Pleurodeles waltl TaxID=8319 RepID=A0AAV7W0I3_PLEWA|nr:hypothetical protein NDU88_001982 [Pleurodeles waltl]
MHNRTPTTTGRIHRPPGFHQQMPAPPVLTAEKELRENVARTARRPQSLPASFPQQEKKGKNTGRTRRALPAAAIAS